MTAAQDTAADSIHQTLATDTTDSIGDFRMVLPAQGITKDSEPASPGTYNPFAAACLSVVLPGAGQFYCRKPLRGMLFLAADGLWAAYGINRYNYFKKTLQKPIDDNLRDAAGFADSLSRYTPDTELYKRFYDDFLDAQISCDIARYRQRVGRYAAYHGTGWASGIYLWNILDAVNCTNRTVSATSRDPGKAARLSAIPYLGLGQIYNGALNKAGLVWTTQTMLTVMAYNYNRLMNVCITRRHQAEHSSTMPESVRRNAIAGWDDEYDNASRKRNTYLWYLILFYFYGVFDAAVDAHLHDYDSKVRLRPALNAGPGAVSAAMVVDF